MRIIYDGQIYLQPLGGINRYFNNLIDRLPENFTPVVTTCTKPGLQFPNHPNLKTFFYPRFGFRPGRLSYWLEKYYFRYVTSDLFELAHPTYYSLLTQQPVNNYRCPVVLTVHDMIHEIFAEQMDPTGQQAQAKWQAVLAAQAILCVSENTKKDLIEWYSIPESKITVTHLASELNANMAYGSEPVPLRPYYLYVGGRAWYKNFDSLLLAFAKVVSVQTDIALCIVGSPFNDTEGRLIGELNLMDRIEHYEYPSDTHLAKLYRCSIGLVYPSAYEGFGIPLLEAMSCQTAVIASNCSSIPEVVGDAGILFEPKLIDDLADIMLSLVDDPIKRDRLIDKGYQRSHTFSWDQTAAQTIDVYRSVSN